MLQNSPFNSVASPMGALVMAATDPSLNGSPDWSKNMDICDMINTARDNSDADRAAKCILRRLQESDAKIITLALTLSETCMKNCARFSKVVDQQFMDEMVGVTRGFKGKQNGLEALRMIQQWAKCLPARDGRSSAFHDTYKAMRNRGISFPESDEAPAVFQIPEQTDAVRPRVEVFSSLIEKDLATVFEKVRLCREMLPNSRGIDRDDALAEVIGFLEACRDRMVDLIDAGLQGTLGPNNNDMLVECLRANNAIFRTLEAEQYGLRIPLTDEDDDFDESAYDATDSMPGPEGAGIPKPRSKVVKASPLLPKGPLKRPSFLHGSGAPSTGMFANNAPATPDRYAGVSSSSASPAPPSAYPNAADLPVPSEYPRSQPPSDHYTAAAVAAAAATATATAEPYHEVTGYGDNANYGYQAATAAAAATDPSHYQYAAESHAPAAATAAGAATTSPSTAEIEAAWHSAYDDEGTIYYYNTVTQVSQYEHPHESHDPAAAYWQQQQQLHLQQQQQQQQQQYPPQAPYGRGI